MRRTSIRTLLMATYVTTVLLAAAGISFASFGGWIATVRDMLARTSAWVSHDVSDTVDQIMQVPYLLVKEQLPLLERGILDLGDETRRAAYFGSMMRQQAGTAVYSFALGRENGEYHGARRSPEGAWQIMLNTAETGGRTAYYPDTPLPLQAEPLFLSDPFDPRTRSWYKAGMGAEAGTVVFSPVYPHFLVDDLAISAVAAVQENGRGRTGVLAAHMTLSDLSDALAEAYPPGGTRAMVVERRNGVLVADSGGAPLRIDTGAGTQRRPLDASVDAALTQAWTAYNQSDRKTQRFRTDQGWVTVTLEPFTRYGLDWLILTSIPETTLMGGLRSLIANGMLWSALAALLALAAALLVADRILRPLRGLAGVAERYIDGDYRQRATAVREDEIGELAHAFNRMADTIATFIDSLEHKVAERTAQLEETNAALEGSREQLRLILDSTAEGIYGIDAQGNCTFCNTGCLRLLKYASENDLLGQNMHWKLHHHRLDGTILHERDCAIQHVLQGGPGIHVEEEVFWRADGTPFDVAYSAFPQRHGGRTVGVVISFTDITETRRTERRVLHLSQHDALTGLANRLHFEDVLRRCDAEARYPLAVLFCDVNGLKLTNDIFGHVAGDALLREAAGFLKRHCRDGDLVARVGGDEFIALFPETSRTQAGHIRDRILETFAHQTEAAFGTGISIGIAVKDAPGTNIEDVVAAAEEAMYANKATDRKRIGETVVTDILHALFERSAWDRRHAAAVERLALATARALGMPESEARRVAQAGRLHDIGKIALEDDLLRVPEAQREPLPPALLRHAAVGYRIVNLSDETLGLAEAILHHHERWDGSGYPKGLAGEEIPLMARILAAAECYDTVRNGAGLLPRDEAIGYMRDNRGILFDPRVVDALLDVADSADPSAG